MIALYHTLISYPLLNALIALYNTIAFEDLGLAIIFLTIIIRILLYPIFQKSIRYQAAMQAIQPKLKKVQEDHKDNREEQSRAMLALYKEHKVNPFSGFFFILIQLPILIALYQLFLQSLSSATLTGLYPFITAPSVIHTTLLGLINLKNPSIVIVAATAVAQYVQGRMMLSSTPKTGSVSSTERTQRQMVFVGPILTIVIFFRLPAAVTLYWCVTSLASIAQQYFVNKEFSHGPVESLHKKNN